MFPISPARRLAARGFSLLETMVALAAMGVVMAIGIPSVTNWVQASKARSAVDHYAEGLALARRLAISNNGASRIVLTPNASNDQNDWQVDICFPNPAAPCTATAGGWSTTIAPAAGDPAQANGYTSVLRLATALPKAGVVATQLLPAGASAIYFNSFGWVDTNVPQRMTSLRFIPGNGYDQVRPAALVIGLAGTATRCDWSVAAPDSRACPP